MRKVVLCLIVTLGLALTASADTRVEKILKIDSGGSLEVDTEMGSITSDGDVPIRRQRRRHVQKP